MTGRTYKRVDSGDAGLHIGTMNTNEATFADAAVEYAMAWKRMDASTCGGPADAECAAAFDRLRWEAFEMTGAREAQERLSLMGAERDGLWAAMHGVALNLCDCDARDGDECPVHPTEHREHCEYALAHRPRAVQDNASIDWGGVDPNLSLADGPP